MGQIRKILVSSAWLVLWAVSAANPANAQNRYPSIDDAWDATDYRAMVQRVENDGLALPTISNTKDVFERMVSADNIPLRMGQNSELPITIRYQKLEPVLQPLRELIAFYSKGAQNGKPYATELAKLRLYESKAAAVLMDIGTPYLATLKGDARYQTHVALFDQLKDQARGLYAGLVKSMTETNLYSKSDILEMTKGAFNLLSSYQPIFTDQNRQELTASLSKQIAATSDQEVKSALTELHDAIKHRRVPT